MSELGCCLAKFLSPHKAPSQGLGGLVGGLCKAAGVGLRQWNSSELAGRELACKSQDRTVKRQRLAWPVMSGERRHFSPARARISRAPIREWKGKRELLSLKLLIFYHRSGITTANKSNRNFSARFSKHRNARTCFYNSMLFIAESYDLLYFLINEALRFIKTVTARIFIKWL